MKITEVRNNLFGLTDLKSLLSENTFYEAGRAGGDSQSFDWDHFFMDEPEKRLSLTYPNFKAMAQDPEQVKILTKYNFNGKMPSAAAFSNARTRSRGKIGGNADNFGSVIKFFEDFFASNSNGINPDVLYAYEEQFNSNAVTPEVAKGVENYFTSIINLAINSVKEATNNGINLSGIGPKLIEDGIDGSGNVVSFVFVPKSLFFFFVNACVKSGRGVHLKPYLDKVPACFSKFIKSYYNATKANAGNIEFSENDVAQTDDLSAFSQQLQGGFADFGKSYKKLVEVVFLKPLGIKYGTYLSQCADILYKAYFNGNNINKIVSVIGQIKAERVNTLITMTDSIGARGEFRNTAGALMYCAVAALMSYDLNIQGLVGQMAEVMPGNDFAPFRNALYRKKFELITGNVFEEEYLTDVSDCFSVPYDFLFDPLFNMQFRSVNAGFRKWVMEMGRSLSELQKNPLYTTIDVADPNSGYISPIEKIFLSAHTLKRRLDSSLKKYGTGPEKHGPTIELLLSEAAQGIQMFNEMNPTNRIPQAQKTLSVMYQDIESGMNDKTDELGFWQLLEHDNQIKDKTQTDIYYFLVDHSAKGVNWKYEYNRNDKVDEDLGQKSIDIMAEIPGHRFCFEYQGEQHYRLLQVKLEDDKQFPMFLLMKYYILNTCGFNLEKIGQYYYVTGLKPEIWEQNKDNLKSIIINTYIEFLTYITKYPRITDKSLNIDASVNNLLRLGTASTSQQLQEDLAGHSVNRNFKYFSGQQKKYIDYFNEIISKGAENEEVFEEPALTEQIPYIGSPVRFMDEIQTAVNMARDWEKRDVLRNKKDGIWDVAYIVPKKTISSDDIKYTEMLAGKENVIFKWEGPKKKNSDLVSYMVANGIGEEKEPIDKKTTIKENFTLFEAVVKEAFKEHTAIQQDKSIIYQFMENYSDFSDSDIENGYERVYRPGWHTEPFQFWFNPPYDENGYSVPVLSGTIILLNDGKIMVESMRDNLFYDLDACLGNSVGEFIFSIQRRS